MVREWGLSPRLGPVGYSSDGPGYLGDAGLSSRPYAEATQRAIDEEVAVLLRAAEDRATELLSTHREHLDRIVDLLLDRETIDGADLMAIVEPGWSDGSAPRAGMSMAHRTSWRLDPGGSQPGRKE